MYLDVVIWRIFLKYSTKFSESFKADNSIANSEILSIEFNLFSVYFKILLPNIFNLEETNFENINNTMNTGRLNKNKFNPNILNKTRIPPTANNNSEIIETTEYQSSQQLNYLNL